VVEEQTRPWTWRPRRFGDSLDDYGPVLWGGAALRSTVIAVVTCHRVFVAI